MKEKLVATVVLYLTNKQGVEKVIENINSYAPFAHTNKFSFTFLNTRK